MHHCQRTARYARDFVRDPTLFLVRRVSCPVSIGSNRASGVLKRQIIYFILLVIAVAVSIYVVDDLSEDADENLKMYQEGSILYKAYFNFIFLTVVVGIYFVSRFFANPLWRVKDFYIVNKTVLYSMKRRIFISHV